MSKNPILDGGYATLGLLDLAASRTRQGFDSLAERGRVVAGRIGRRAETSDLAERGRSVAEKGRGAVDNVKQRYAAAREELVQPQ